MELLLIFWCLIWGAICYGIGSRKGSPGYFFLGVIFGPLGIVFSLIGKGNRINCPYCKKLIDPKATVCPYCQREVGIEVARKIARKILEAESPKHRLFRKITLLLIVIWFVLVCVFPHEFIPISLVFFISIFSLTVFNRKFAKEQSHN